MLKSMGWKQMKYTDSRIYFAVLRAPFAMSILAEDLPWFTDLLACNHDGFIEGLPLVSETCASNIYVAIKCFRYGVAYRYDRPLVSISRGDLQSQEDAVYILEACLRGKLVCSCRGP